MKRSTFLFSLCVAFGTQSAIADETPTAPSPPTLNEVRAACEADAQKLCPGVEPGGGRILACLKQHRGEVSDGCKQAIIKAKQNT
ncbi:MAG TPA: cysteine rich repeat-containing protein [Steroidobacteraceae bacterium]|nr:cysteine rich repeat-containing protein [Steroidobacteraceae bacterium]